MANRLRSIIAAAALLAGFGLFTSNYAQEKPAKNTDPPLGSPAVVFTGYIAPQAPSSNLQVVGSAKENIKYTVTEGDQLYLNKGIEGGMKVGAMYSVIRPLGDIYQPFTKKKLGVYIREIAVVKVTAVQGATSTAKVISAHEGVWMGDLLVPYQPFEEPQERVRQSSNESAPLGQIIMSQEYREYLGTNDIVYLDFGFDQGAQPGDVYSVYRKTGAREGITHYRDDKIYQDRNKDFGSNRFHGGDYSIDAPRVRRDKVLDTRPTLPLREVGHLVLLKVDGKTSVARITGIGEELNIGDMVGPSQQQTNQ